MRDLSVSTVGKADQQCSELTDAHNAEIGTSPASCPSQTAEDGKKLKPCYAGRFAWLRKQYIDLPPGTLVFTSMDVIDPTNPRSEVCYVFRPCFMVGAYTRLGYVYVPGDGRLEPIDLEPPV